MKMNRLFRFSGIASALVAALLPGCGAEPIEALGQQTSELVEASLMSPSFHSGLYVPFDDLAVGLGDAQVVANGNAALSFVAPNFDGTVDGDEVATFATTINLRAALKIGRAHV